MSKSHNRTKKNGWFIRVRLDPRTQERRPCSIRYVNGKEVEHRWLDPKDVKHQSSLGKLQDIQRTNQIQLEKDATNRKYWEKYKGETDYTGQDDGVIKGSPEYKKALKGARISRTKKKNKEDADKKSKAKAKAKDPSKVKDKSKAKEKSHTPTTHQKPEEKAHESASSASHSESEKPSGDSSSSFSSKQSNKAKKINQTKRTKASHQGRTKKPRYSQEQWNNLPLQQCRGFTKKNVRCRNLTRNPNGFCPDHLYLSAQSERGKLMDRKHTAKQTLPMTPENLKLWASNPRKYDIEGIDTKLDEKSPEFQKVLQNYRNSQIFKSYQEKKSTLQKVPKEPVSPQSSEKDAKKSAKHKEADDKPWEYVDYEDKDISPSHSGPIKHDDDRSADEEAFYQQEAQSSAEPKAKRMRKPKVEAVQCKHSVIDGKVKRRCKKMTTDPSGYCREHNPNKERLVHLGGKGKHKFRTTPSARKYSKEVMTKHLYEVASAQGDAADLYDSIIDQYGIDPRLDEDENWERIKAQIMSAAMV
jgi:hypothetical protein